ncbi:SMI1/KNR4 family protein [Gloeothece verrucosa]|uniref:Cell wall assembly/cell proliferation coordinating protein, KNR4-like protein n=1 Tax=Gloeothece verrucosa (strain PCC 7822) TaxID=497965 RepID=E0UIB6_GLOV7|nr:SMI1/KNR4 family protein [Gloeothece verrucosa]ADN16884.1 Cell wall assembly/cell proliferation coordinating protein, KNR4-like protein [Gloeothece verrucosa PCC 7822]
MTNNFRLDEIKDKLTRLAEFDKSLNIHGSEIHQYQLYPCLSPSSLRNFEQQYQMTFPEDYRHFLLEVGNGGAGPGYGLFQLKTEDLLDEQTLILEKQYESGMLPEKLAEKYNYFSQAFSPQCLPLYQTSQDWESQIKNTGNNQEDWQYLSQKLMAGTLAIADYGCGINAHLVITGDYRGTIWIDDRVNDGGIYPCDLIACGFFHGEDQDIDDQEEQQEIAEPLFFLDWYNHWLDSSLRS